MACPRFTVPAMSASVSSTQDSTNQITEYVSSEDVIIDDYDYDLPLSPASSSDDEGSLTSSASTIDDLDDDFEQECQQLNTPAEFVPQTYDPEEAREQQFIYHTQEFVPQKYSGPMPVQAPVAMPPQPIMCQQPMPPSLQVPVSAQVPCQPKSSSYFPIWDMVKYVQQVPMLQHHVPFHQQVPFMPTFQGCY